MELEKFIMYAFTFIGMVVCICVTLIALVWGTCFVIRLLAKTFGAKITTTCDIIVEDIKSKAAIKKDLKAQARNAKKEQKEERLKLKIENKRRINEIKNFKLKNSYRDKEAEICLKELGYVPAMPQEEFQFSEPVEEANEPNFDEEVLAIEENNTEEPVMAQEEVGADYFDYSGEGNEETPAEGEVVEPVVLEEESEVAEPVETTEVEEIVSEPVEGEDQPVEPVLETEASEEAPVEDAPKSKRGRKKGSKNKLK